MERRQPGRRVVTPLNRVVADPPTSPGAAASTSVTPERVRYVAIRRVFIDYLFHICHVHHQSAATKFNALALLRTFISAQRDNGSRLHLARSASTNVIIYASLIISSKYFETTRYRLSQKTLWDDLVANHPTKKIPFSKSDLIKAEFELLKAVDFHVDMHGRSSYFWASAVAMQCEWPLEDVLEINEYLDEMLSIAVLDHEVEDGNHIALDALMLQCALTIYGRRHHVARFAVEEILAEAAGLSVAQLALEARIALKSIC
ncbi:Cyclin N-terminal domain-containing protein [Plasmodiophora brassicae]